MFRKPFKVRSNTTIRGSERRRLRENIGKQFVHLTSEDLAEIIPNKDEMTVMKIYTHNEKNVTCYCLRKNPVFIETENMLLPTVFLLWEHPKCITLSLNTFPNVFSNLSGGADLMFPGVIPPPNGLPYFDIKTVCYVTLLGNSAAVAVGVTMCSSEEIMSEGLQGKRVTIYHCFNDHLWSAGEKTDLPLMSESVIEKPLGHVDNYSTEEDIVDQFNTEQHSSNGEHVVAVSAETSPELVSSNDHPSNDDVEHFNVETDKVVLSPQEEMDQLLENCFCQALLDAKKIELPVLVSTFSSQYLHPVCPDGKRLEVKKSSYKKMSKFLSEMQANGLVKVQELSKGVESITAITLENETLRRYKSSKFSRLMKETKELKLLQDQEATQNNKSLEIRELYAVSAKTMPFFKFVGLSKGAALCSTEVRKYVTDYVKSNQLTNPSNKKKVNLDALLTDVLFGKNDYEESLTWDQLLTRMLNNMNSCHEITLPGKKPIIKKGKMEQIEVSIEQRMGNKKVTIVKNLEHFGIDVKSFAQELQQTAASSTAVNPTPGKNVNTHFVLVQGVQTKHIKILLDRYRIPTKYIKGLDGKDKKK